MDFPTQYWHKLPDGRIQCDICPRACKLKENQRGFCFVRQRKNNQVVLTTYGLSTGFCIDPVEKKPLNHFLPGTPILSFGTAGCNLGCKFCQNWDISASKETAILSAKASPEDIAKAAKKHHCRSVAFTYNEPTIFMEYAVDTAKECHKLGIKTVAVTNGYICAEPRREFYSHMDAANVDLKGFTEEFYKKITYSTLQPVLDTLVYLKHHTKVWFEITTLLIPGKNDSNEEIEKLTQWVVKELGPDVPIHFTAFFPAFKMLDVPPTPLETLVRARDIALKNGIYYAYTGNAYNVETSSTYCHHCKKCVIKRGGYEILDYQLDKSGKCKFCHTPCAGVFEEKPGDWGSKREPIVI
ncbi:MAG: AmmeMemoRadiSam system radical SAM enzyme [Gammaproteobacteria bacterium]|nr:AmmeMemoRadiSam system radical SAM enzyme [Gammaproteobacteria bacterium]